MKKVLISSVILFAGMISVSAQTGTKTAAKTTTKSTTKATTDAKALQLKNLLDSFSYAAGVNVATNMKSQGITKVNALIMQKGIDDVFKNSTPVLTTEAGNACLQKQLGLFAAEKGAAEKAKGVAFLEANKKRAEVKTLPDGLQYEVIKNGDANGVHPKPVDTVVVNYIGTLVDVKEPFDDSYKRGQPAAFPLTNMIKGWIEVLQLMKIGDHWKVYIPTELGYGAVGNGAVIPPNAALIFEITLEDIRPAVAVEAPKTGQ